jgi:hypothetical protein
MSKSHDKTQNNQNVMELDILSIVEPPFAAFPTAFLLWD